MQGAYWGCQTIWDWNLLVQLLLISRLLLLLLHIHGPTGGSLHFLPRWITTGDDSLSMSVECESESDVWRLFKARLLVLLLPYCSWESLRDLPWWSYWWWRVCFSQLGCHYKEIIESYTSLETGSELCTLKGNEEAFCFPTSTAPENSRSIFPGGATAGDDFVPFSLQQVHVGYWSKKPEYLRVKKIGLRDFLLPRCVWRFPLARQLKQKEEYLDVEMTMRFLLERSETHNRRCLDLLPEMVFFMLCSCPWRIPVHHKRHKCLIFVDTNSIKRVSEWHGTCNHLNAEELFTSITVLHLLHISEMATHNSLILGQLYSTIFIPFRHTWLPSYKLTFDNENINTEVDTLEFLSCERFMVFIFMQMLPQKGDVLSIRNRRSIVEGIGSPRLCCIDCFAPFWFYNAKSLLKPWTTTDEEFPSLT